MHIDGVKGCVYMILLSELQIKEVIIVNSGRRLGHIYDLEIDPTTGKIVAIILLAKTNNGGLFSKPEEIIIYWEQIVTIGTDVILVTDTYERSYIVDTPTVQH